MALTQAQCAQFNDFLARRPYNWDQRIAKDRKPSDYIYTNMYKTTPWPSFTGTTHLHERIYVTRPNDTGLWSQFVADPCFGNPCDADRKYIGHGVDQMRYDRFRTEYQTPVFCLDQLNTIEEAVQKMAAIAEGYKEIPEAVTNAFMRLMVLRKCGTAANLGGLWLAGIQDSQGNPVAIDISDDMFAVSQGESLVQSNNSLLINLNAHGGLTSLSVTTTALLQAALGQLTMEYLNNAQEDLAANGYHNKDWLPAGKFSITVDATTRRKLLVANPALTNIYKSADFAKGGSFYSYGVTDGCGDWLFKEDKEQMRFRYRGDMDGKDFSGNALAGAVWIEQVQPFQNVAATFGLKPVYSTAWKNAPIRLYHAYNRDCREMHVADIESVNGEMKFGLARAMMGTWSWKSPDYFKAMDPTTGVVCEFNNDKKNKGYWLAEWDLSCKTIYPEIEKVILAVGEPQPYVRVPRTVAAPSAPTSSTDYQALLAYNSGCGEYNPGSGFNLPVED